MFPALSLDPVFLSRLQFGLTISFHYIFPVFSIGLGLLLVIMEGLYLKTGKDVYHQMTHFWVSIFALIFGIGVATGIVMEFQFGTNWSNYSRFVGDVFGSALAAEGVFAFFLESGFLGILLFGWDRVSKPMHFLATLMVALGAHFSAIWIVVANAWQQTPAGYHLVRHNGLLRAEITDFWAMVFNPSMLSRLSHTLTGAWLAGAFLVLSVSAYYLLRKKHIEVAQAGIKVALCVALISSLLQLVSGHESALVASKYQPVKLAAMEGHYNSKGPANLSILGWVDEAKQKTYSLAIPGGLAFLTKGDFNARLPGLDQFAKRDRPPVQFVFQFYHLMVAIGMALIGLSVLGCLFWWRGILFTANPLSQLLLLAFVPSGLLPQIANQMGWFTAEVGRQPWVVYGLLRTAHATSPSVHPAHILASIIMFSFVYVLLFCLFIFLLNHKVSKGPDANPHEEGESDHFDLGVDSRRENRHAH
jgi:cytochrome d ubiquinol oxidase subunit I